MENINESILSCNWPGDDELMIHYHDNEWGRPLKDDKKLFEFLLLEFFQAGLSWKTILHKRENFREAFDNFDPEEIANYDQKKVDELLNNAGIIRNKLKVAAAINNAQIYLKIQKEQGSFSDYIWQFVAGKPIVNKFKSLSEIPAETELSKKMSKQMKKDGFKFMGSTICYAFMQATGMVNDHIITCSKYDEINNLKI